MILCLFNPFKIPNIVLATKKIGADKEESLIYRPKSSLWKNICPNESGIS